MIFHITTQILWNHALKKGFYQPDSFETEGFIHCSSRAQVLRSARRYYVNEPEPVLLAIDDQLLGDALVWENTSGGIEPFPHLYAPLNIHAWVIAAAPLLRDEDGGFLFPEPLANLP